MSNKAKGLTVDEDAAYYLQAFENFRIETLAEALWEGRPNFHQQREVARLLLRLMPKQEPRPMRAAESYISRVEAAIEKHGGRQKRGAVTAAYKEIAQATGADHVDVAKVYRRYKEKERQFKQDARNKSDPVAAMVAGWLRDDG